MVSLLVEEDGEVAALNRDGLLPLHYACMAASPGCVSALIAAAGAQAVAMANAQTNAKHSSPLHFAAAALSGDVVEILLASGADPSLVDATGLTSCWRWLLFSMPLLLWSCSLCRHSIDCLRPQSPSRYQECHRFTPRPQKAPPMWCTCLFPARRSTSMPVDPRAPPHSISRR